MEKLIRIQELQAEIDILESEREAMASFAQRRRTDHFIADLECQIDCLREACE